MAHRTVTARYKTPYRTVCRVSAMRAYGTRRLAPSNATITTSKGMTLGSEASVNRVSIETSTPSTASPTVKTVAARDTGLTRDWMRWPLILRASRPKFMSELLQALRPDEWLAAADL